MNSSESDFHGVWVAMVSPWNQKLRAPDRDALKGLIERLANSAVAGLYILGTTGEGTLMSVSERKEFAEMVLDIATGRVPVIVHAGHDRTDAACDMARHAADIGVVAVAAAPPCRYSLTEQELLNHYRWFASSVGDLPVFIYDIPTTTGNPLGGGLLAKLRDQAPNVVGAKVSRRDWEAWEEYLDLAKEVSLLIGTDEMGFPLLSLGGAGLVSSCANIFPELYVALYQASASGDNEKGGRLQSLIIELCRATRRGHVPTIKRALSIMGRGVGPPIPPLLPIEETDDLPARLASIRKQAAQLMDKGGGN
jgi:dihydrodipicolinate synthase/N-acetylneuraminate lyase